MILSEMIEKIAQEGEYEKKDVKKVLDTLFKMIETSLRAREEVRIPGFGKFVVRAFKERGGFNPRTKEKTIIPATERVKFVLFGNLKNI